MKWGIHFDLANKEKRIEELEREMEAPNFWDDTETSQKKMKELKSYKDDVEVYRQLETSYEDIETLIEMGYEENDASIIPEIEEELNSLKRKLWAASYQNTAIRRVWPQWCNPLPACRGRRNRVLWLGSNALSNVQQVGFG